MSDFVCQGCGRTAMFLVADPLGRTAQVPICPACLMSFVPPAVPAISLDEIKNRKFDLIARWTCHVCGKERPDAEIAVAKRDVGAEYGLPEGIMTLNVRHCADDPDCAEKAKTWNFPKG